MDSYRTAPFLKTQYLSKKVPPSDRVKVSATWPIVTRHQGIIFVHRKGEQSWKCHNGAVYLTVL